MINHRKLFLDHLGQTSTEPLAIEIERAEGSYMYGTDGKAYLDLIAGISVSNTGHRHPKVVEAIKAQTDKYLHLMVYGELVQAPQVLLAEAISKQAPDNMDSVFLVNSGSEAIEGAIKLARRYTAKYEILSFNNAYHGSTAAAQAAGGSLEFSRAFRPLPSGHLHADINSMDALDLINENTAAVLIEPIQGEAGIVPAEKEFLKALSEKCKEKGCLLIFDEVQSGFGRTGKFFALEHFGVKPDIIAMAKGMGGGMPIGGFMSSKEIMMSLTERPVLGHISTFGGHPLSSAAALASLQVILEENLISEVEAKENLFRSLLEKHSAIKEIRSKGLMMACDLENFDAVKELIRLGLENGIMTDWFLFKSDAFRIAPPLTISTDEIKEACQILNHCLDKL